MATTLSGLIAYFAAMKLAVEHDEHSLKKGALLLQEEAKSALGTYRYGWPSLSDKTIARKATGDSPLLETGELRDSIEVVMHSNGKEASVGSNSEKAVWHELGTRTIPPRPFMSSAAAAKEDEIVAAIASGVKTTLKVKE